MNAELITASSSTRHEPHQREEGPVLEVASISPYDLTKTEWSLLRSMFVQEIQAGKMPSRDQVRALFTRYIDEQLRSREIEEEIDAQEIAAAQLNSTSVVDLDSKQEEFNIKERKTKWSSMRMRSEAREATIAAPVALSRERWSTTSGRKLIDRSEWQYKDTFLDEDCNNPEALSLCMTCLRLLSEEERQNIANDAMPYFVQIADLYGEFSAFFRSIKPHDYAALNTDDKIKELHPYLDTVSKLSVLVAREKDGEMRYRISALVGADWSDFHTALPIWIEYLAEKDNIDEALAALGSVIYPPEYPRVMNHIRELLTDTRVEQKKKDNLKRMGRALLGETTDDASVEVFPSLNELYKATAFDTYKPNVSATEYDVNFAETIIAATGGNNLLQIGCGTGRHLEAFDKKKLEGSALRVYGIDANRAHVDQAKMKVSNPDDIQLGSWTDLPYETDSMEVVMSLGRDMPHVESETGFVKTLREVYRVLKPGGMFVFDMPDPDKGAYLDAKAAYINALHALHMPEDAVQTAVDQQLGYIIDGPEAGKLYNRYAPNPAKVEAVVMNSTRPFGFKESVGYRVPFFCREVRRAPIDDDKGSENVLFVAYKPDMTPYHELQRFESATIAYRQELSQLQLALEKLMYQLDTMIPTTVLLEAVTDASKLMALHEDQAFRSIFSKIADIKKQMTTLSATTGLSVVCEGEEMSIQNQELDRAIEMVARRQFDAKLERIEHALSEQYAGGE